MSRIIVAIVGATCIAASADAQNTTYRVFDLGEISSENNAILRDMEFWNEHEVTLPFRINSTGQGVGHR